MVALDMRRQPHTPCLPTSCETGPALQYHNELAKVSDVILPSMICHQNHQRFLLILSLSHEDCFPPCDLGITGGQDTYKFFPHRIHFSCSQSSVSWIRLFHVYATKEPTNLSVEQRNRKKERLISRSPQICVSHNSSGYSLTSVTLFSMDLQPVSQC